MNCFVHHTAIAKRNLNFGCFLSGKTGVSTICVPKYGVRVSKVECDSHLYGPIGAGALAEVIIFLMIADIFSPGAATYFWELATGTNVAEYNVQRKRKVMT